MKAAAIIALMLVGAASVEAGAWKAPQLRRPKMRKLSEHDDDCVPGGTKQKLVCENGVPTMKFYAGTDTGCTGTVFGSDSSNAALLLSYCTPLDECAAPGSPAATAQFGCVGNVSKVTVYSSSDCSGDCAMTMTVDGMEDFDTVCKPSTCDDDDGEDDEEEPCADEDDEDDEDGEDDEDDDDGAPACLASCPEPTEVETCAYIASLLAGDSASCMDGCAGSASEMEVNMQFVMCGLPTVGVDSCPVVAASTTPPATTTPPSAAGRVTGALGVVAAALGAVLM